MNRIKHNYILDLTASVVFIATLNSIDSLVFAQITPDNTLGDESSQVTPVSELEQKIEGGAIRGENLFHSFSEFNINENQVVNFSNPDNIINIFSRVTGNNVSQILGDLGVSGAANLFLINPNGIVFGENASLNVNGSFVATTADRINFADDTQFIANSTEEQPLLTVNVPIGLQFDNQPGKIINRAQSFEKKQSNGQQNNNLEPAGLLVRENKTLALIGGEILLEGGNLTARGGNIELGSVGSNSLVDLDVTDKGFSFDYQSVTAFSNITLTNREGLFGPFPTEENGQLVFTFIPSPLSSNLEAISETTTGSINIWGNNIDVINGSQIRTPTTGDNDGGNIVIGAREKLNINGNNLLRGLNPLNGDIVIIPIFSGIFTTTVGNGNAGSIEITAKRLEVNDSTVISSDSNFIFNSETGELVFASGDAGNIDIVVSESITISEGSSINTNSLGTGNAGEIRVKAKSLNLDSGGRISASTVQSDGGNINLEIDDNLELRNKSQISASVGEDGNGGNIDIITDFLITSPEDNSDITTTADLGRGGNIKIKASEIIGISHRSELSDLSDIVVDSRTGADGTIVIESSTVQTENTEIETEVEFVETVTSFSPDSCYASKRNKYILVGRGGLPLASTRTLIPQYTWEDWRIIDSENQEEVVITNKNNNSTNSHSNNQILTEQNQIASITPVQGWSVNQKGEIILTANPVMVTPHAPEMERPGC